MWREAKEGMITTRPRLMFVTSPIGGLAHYVVHLWQPMSRHADLLYVTQKDTSPDELVRDHVPHVLPVLDSRDTRTISDVVDIVLESNVQIVNLHSGTRVQMDYRYFVELLKELGRVGIRRVLHLHNVATFRAAPDSLQAATDLSGHSDAILVGSHREKDVLGRLADLGEKSVCQMRHGPYDMMNRGRCDRASARRFLNLEPDSAVVLFFGDLRREKRLDDLLEAFRVVQKQLPRVRLVVQSNPRYEPSRRAWLQARARERGIRVDIGYASFLRLEVLFKAADVVALPYEIVASSGVLNLARAFRRPVILTEAFEQAGLIDGVSGYVVPPGQPQALAEALTKLLSLSEVERRALGDGWDRAMEADSWSAAADALWNACVPVEVGRNGASQPTFTPTRRREATPPSPP